MTKKSPFIFGKSSDLINYTDREEESVRLEMNLKSLINTTIISPRRWGKTSLVENVAKKIRIENEKIKVCMLTQKVDILDPVFKLWLKEDFFKVNGKRELNQ